MWAVEGPFTCLEAVSGKPATCYLCSSRADQSFRVRPRSAERSVQSRRAGLPRSCSDSSIQEEVDSQHAVPVRRRPLNRTDGGSLNLAPTSVARRPPRHSPPLLPGVSACDGEACTAHEGAALPAILPEVDVVSFSLSRCARWLQSVSPGLRRLHIAAKLCSQFIHFQNGPSS